ncbi:Predicted DNA-binding transcriptional regulator YafY, contains an HTH and WYL domains [Actinopolyspora alba]|uniref:Predicted DNA-binding transcriptional regulator YafY, contains an HTH and WYL domains n=1 Tax=Actinopolyspora alba TaxID=673379 RepID=A0A1I2AR18_9ACTN|nr:YafY family protein [Actinopolyspora alba]SFE46342.1 Predicted DNA-binding transcriptional regulator YafY, contains an HTH and WYL domains [Actinopolyspora alba]
MTRPIARVLALLEILQRGGTRTVAELSERLDVDERTVRRYVDHLLDLDIPVRSVRGRHGGYRLSPGYRMPPLMLTDEEALAVLLGLVAGRHAGLLSTSVVAAESAVAKVRRVLPEALGRRLDALLEIADFTTPARSALTAEAEVLLTVAEAARDRRPVDLRYVAGHGGASERVVHPYGVVAHSGRWYLTGFDSASGQLRTFRVDRITTVGMRAGTFEVPVGFDPAQRVLTTIAETPYQHEVSVRIRSTPEQIYAVLPPSVVKLERIDPGTSWLRARIRAQRLEWIPPLLAALDRPFVVEQPEELRDLVRALAGRLADYADA